MTRRIAFIGGTGLTDWPGARPLGHSSDTPWGSPSATAVAFDLPGVEVVFLARHGRPHRIAPHDINYRANIHLLHELGCAAVLAVNAVGGIAAGTGPGALVVPDQLIDYTTGRAGSFSTVDRLLHVDFTEPYDATLRAALLAGAAAEAIGVVAGGVYGCTQGPRLETRAEIDRLERDGCTLVGMTGMPEAALARELALPYATICLSVNAAAGRGAGPIALDAIEPVLVEGMARVRRVLVAAVRALAGP